MIEMQGIDNLIANQDLLKGAGWIFTGSREDLSAVQSIIRATYFIAEDPDEEIDMEDTHVTFLEFGIFKAVVELESEAGRHSKEDIATSCLYYLEKDTFRD